MWVKFFDAHSIPNLVNPDTEERYNIVDKNAQASLLAREFFRHLQGLTESELKRCSVHCLGETVGRTLSYPKIYVKKPKHKAGTYSIKQWCDHKKLKTAAMRELSALVPFFKIFKADGDIDSHVWTQFKMAYNINGASMRHLVKEHEAVLKSKGNKRMKKTETDPKEKEQCLAFLDRKKIFVHSGTSRFCMITCGVGDRLTFTKWDGSLTRQDVKED
jgi:hypothetical protein